MGNDFLQQLQALAAMLGQGGIGHNTPSEAPMPNFNPQFNQFHPGTMPFHQGQQMPIGNMPNAQMGGGIPGLQLLGQQMHLPHQQQVLGAHNLASQLAHHVANNRHAPKPFAGMGGY